MGTEYKEFILQVRAEGEVHLKASDIWELDIPDSPTVQEVVALLRSEQYSPLSWAQEESVHLKSSLRVVDSSGTESSWND